MKRKKFLDTIKGKSNSELEKMIKDGRSKLQQLRFDLASGKVKNVKDIKVIQKEVARLLTVMKINEQKA